MTNSTTLQTTISYITTNAEAMFNKVNNGTSLYSLSAINRAAYANFVMFQERVAYAKALESGIKGKEMQRMYDRAQYFEDRYQSALKIALRS